jgi:dTDP-4-dehydrorhamnose 3,5-epimerase
MFKIIQSKIPGCYEIVYHKIEDLRGTFIKNYHKDVFAEQNIDMELGEEFFIHSKKRVFRGMHFQTPPKAINKLVLCLMGNVTDYLVDLRVGSPTYGEWASYELDGNNPRAIFVPKGIAHGYYVNSDSALMQYKSSGVYDGICDQTISYTTFSFAENVIDPILSDRDIAAVKFKDFKNEFKF